MRKAKTSHGTVHWTWRVGFGLCISLTGCKTQQLTSQGTEVVTVQAMPSQCEELGLVTGKSGGLLGGYVEKETLVQQATEDAQNRAASLGATHFVARPADIQHGSATAPTRNQQPAMGHGDSSTATVIVTGTAYRCEPSVDPAQISAPPPSGAPTASATRPVAPAPSTRGVTVAGPPTSGDAALSLGAAPAISLAPLGRLQAVTVFQLIPATPRNQAEQIELLKIEEPGTLASLSSALAKAEEAALQFVPTHRIEFTGDLGTQSLLYGFGHLKYSAHSYRLPDNELERTLGLVTVEENDEN